MKQISTYGLIIFDAPFTESPWYPRAFPITQKVVAPYWDDIDLRHKGLVLYDALIEGQQSRLNNSQDIFDTVNVTLMIHSLKRYRFLELVGF